VNLEARLLVMWFLRDREPQRALVLWGSMAARATLARSVLQHAGEGNAL
jgi:hypothetical protein